MLTILCFGGGACHRRIGSRQIATVVVFHPCITSASRARLPWCRPSFTEVLRHEWLASKAAPEADEAGDASATEAKLRELEGELEGEELADELREAEALYRRSLAINEAEHGPRHPSTQKSATGLWNVLNAKGGCEAEVAALRAAHGI